jgi:flagellar biosynthesis/type III secretory pathway protein FliH
VAIIRQAQAQRIAENALVLDLGDLARQGSAITQRARVEAQAILDRAQSEREALLRDASAIGHAHGLAKGLKDGTEQGIKQGQAQALAERKAALQGIEKGWASALQEFARDRETIMQQAKDDVLQLAITLASSVVKRAIEVDPSLVQDQVRAVVQAVMRPTSLVLVVHPADEAIVREAMPSLVRVGLEHVTLATDAALPRGSCVARTPAGGIVDGSIHEQLARIAEALMPGSDAASAAGAIA